VRRGGLRAPSNGSDAVTSLEKLWPNRGEPAGGAEHSNMERHCNLLEERWTQQHSGYSPGVSCLRFQFADALRRDEAHLAEGPDSASDGLAGFVESRTLAPGPIGVTIRERALRRSAGSRRRVGFRVAPDERQPANLRSSVGAGAREPPRRARPGQALQVRQVLRLVERYDDQ
jgi:hypothetical protein